MCVVDIRLKGTYTSVVFLVSELLGTPTRHPESLCKVDIRFQLSIFLSHSDKVKSLLKSKKNGDDC